jgi:hypothetical protein
VSSDAVLLIVTIAFLTIYLVGVGGTTATAIRVRERFRQQKVADSELMPRPGGELVLNAPALPPPVEWLRRIGWLGFIPALVFAVFVVRDYPWVTPVAVILMVAINAFYFTAMQNMGEQLAFTPDGFRLGRGRAARFVRWIHVTELTGARVGTFSAMKMSESDEWQDPRTRPNVIFFRLNRALTPAGRTLYQRLIGFTYYDGVVRNVFGVPTDRLLRAMRDWQRQALETEKLPLRPARP